MAEEKKTTRSNERGFAVVTGASSGIGYQLAKVFAENGYDLLINAESDQLEEARAQLDSLGVSVQTVQADLRKREEVERFWQEVEATGRPVDLIAINAGVGVGGDFVTETDLNQELDIVDLNCRSTVHIAKYASQHMVERGSGRILITASIAGEMTAPLESVYAASKAFDLSFARSLRYELKDRGVSVTALQPGPTDTNFFHRAGMDDTEVGSKGLKENSPEDVARQGFKALMDGDDHIYAGNWKVKAEGTLSTVTPDAAMASMHKKMASKKSA